MKLHQSMRSIGGLVVALSLSLVAAPARARTIGLTADAGTMGFGLNVGTQLIQNTLDLRTGYTHFGLSRSGTYNKSGTTLPYSGHVGLGGIPILLDWFPFHGAFRLTAGVFDNQAEVNANATPAPGSTVQINGDTYTASQVGTLTGRIDYRKMSPYLGLGWGNLAPRGHGFVYNVDLGVLFTGSPQVSLNASNPGNNATLASDVAAAQATAQSDANKVSVWPMLQVGLGYAF
ncbi:MAG: hypothetical protein ACYCRH_08160 [Acidiferrobacteraceae bacterium]